MHPIESKDAEHSANPSPNQNAPFGRCNGAPHANANRRLSVESNHTQPCECDSCLLGLSDHMTLNDSKPRMQQVFNWSKLRSVMYMTMFASKGFTKEWTQLGGHKGGFCQGMQNGTILKLLCSSESECLQKLMSDVLRSFVPEYKGQITLNSQDFVEMQDLLHEFHSPSLMDCKIGTRTYLEKELAKALNDRETRRDLYEKMVEVDANEPTAEEHAHKALTKVRYMQWRETMSSSSTLGFRIEGIKTSTHVQDTNSLKTVKAYDDVKRHFRDFVEHRRAVLQSYIDRLQQLRESLERSSFFAAHEVIGSSLLFVHDRSGRASIWMIDFGKTTKLPAAVRITHRDEWRVGNHEDGYLIGFDNIQRILNDLLLELDENSSP